MCLLFKPSWQSATCCLVLWHHPRWLSPTATWHILHRNRATHPTLFLQAFLSLTHTYGMYMHVHPPSPRWLVPLKPLGVPTQRIALTLLLSLRFMSLVFEEVRNLCLGLAARGVEWRAQGTRGSLEILGRLVVRLFGNLFHRSEKISQVCAGWGLVREVVGGRAAGCGCVGLEVIWACRREGHG